MNYASGGINYSGAAGTGQTPAKLPALSEQASALRSDLMQINNRLADLGDRLLGAIPREATDKANPEPTPSLQLHLDRMQAVVAEIYEKLARIEARI